MVVQTDGPAVCRAHRAISGLREGSGRRGAFFPGGVCEWARWVAPPIDLLNNQESSAAFLASLTDFINVLLRGECPKQMREIMFGGSLIDLFKKVRGSETNSDWVHLQKASCEMRQQIRSREAKFFFAPLQVGVAVPGGGEAAIHASRSFVTNMTEDEIFVKLDFANAFNILRRDIMLQMVYYTIPEIYEFTYPAYSVDSQLQFGPFVVRSQMGPQQGDPLGPLLFCLPLQPVLS